MTKVIWWKSKRTLNTVFFLILVSVFGGFVWWKYYRPYVSTEDARVAMDVLHLAPQGITARIRAVHVSEGDKVKKGDVLVELDDVVAAANFQKSRAKFELTKKEFDRLSYLYKSGVETPQTFERVQSELAIAESDLKLSKFALDNTILKSPSDGVVIQELAKVGDLLENGQTAVVIANTEKVWIAANVEETSVDRLQIGQPVSIEVDSGGHFEGKLVDIRQATASQFALIPSDTGTGNFVKTVQRIPIKIEIEKLDTTLRVGQSVVVRIKVL